MTDSSKQDHLSLYSEYNKTLRAWFVGFGFGVPAAVLLKEHAQHLLLKHDLCERIIWVFIIGASAQILIAFLNKVISWSAYCVLELKEQKKAPCCLWRGFAKLEYFFILDVICDVVTMGCFGYSVFHLIKIFICTPTTG